MQAEKVLRGIALTAVFALPFLVLYVADGMFFPFITGKNFGFRIFVELAACAWIGLALINAAYRPRQTWLLAAFASLVAIMAAADAFGVYPFKSFWSNYERMDGWITLAHLFVYFVVAASVLNTEKLWRAWWHVSLGIAALVAFINMGQLMEFVGNGEAGRQLNALLGNPTYLGIYMTFHVFIAALLWAQSWVEKPRSRRMAALGYGASIVLSFSILFLTSTRAPLLGLFGGAVLAALLFGLFTPDKRVRRIAAIACGVALVFSGAFFLARDTAFIQGIKPLARVANMFEDTTTHSRFMNWGMAFEGFKERPVLGWGHENYAAVFDKYYDPGMYAQEQWFDRTHNVIFDWLVTGGILGLLAYLSLYMFALLALWRSGAFALYERAIFTGLFAGYFFYLLFTFDNITSNILFVATLAYIAMRSGEKERKDVLVGSWRLAKKATPAVAGVALIAAPVFVWAINADGIRQNYALIAGLKQHPGGITENLKSFERALSFESMGTQEAREQLAQTAMKVAGAEAGAVPAEMKQAFFELASQGMAAQTLEAPFNARAPYFGGVMHDTFGDHEGAAELLHIARERSPRKQTILIALGANALTRGDNAAAMQYFKEAHESAPEYDSARLYYAVGAVRTNDRALLDTLLPEILKEGNALDRQLLAAYASLKRYDEIVALAREHIKLFPDDQQARLMLAVALFEGGNPAAAIATLEEAKRAIPAIAAQADALIAQIRQQR